MTVSDPLESQRLPINRVLNPMIDIAGRTLWGTEQSAWQQNDSSQQERQAVITLEEERLSLREIAKKIIKYLWALWLSLSRNVRKLRRVVIKKRPGRLRLTTKSNKFISCFGWRNIRLASANIKAQLISINKYLHINTLFFFFISSENSWWAHRLHFSQSVPPLLLST